MLKEKAVLALAKAIWELLVLLPSQRKQRTILLVAAGLLFSFCDLCLSEVTPKLLLRLSFC